MHIIDMIVAWLLPLLPASLCPLMYWAYRQKLSYKRNDMANLMGRPRTFELYRRTYGKCPVRSPHKPNAPPSEAQIKGVVDPLFDSQYDKRNYFFPLAVVASIMFAIACIGLLRAHVEMAGFPPALAVLVGKLPIACLTAIAGAFVWGMYDLVARFRSIDLTPSSIHYLWLRLLLAPFLGYFVSVPAKDSAAIPLAFLIMTIPISSIRDYLQSQVKKKLGLPDDQAAEKPNLGSLQGMNADTIDMLNDEGIVTVAQLAMIDPFKLLLKTNLEWATILDLIDQAILFNYIGDKLALLRPMGIRGSIEMACLQGGLSSKDPVDNTRGKDRAHDVATKLGQDDASTCLLIETLAEDLRVELIWQLWGDTTPDQNGVSDDSANERPAQKTVQSEEPAGAIELTVVEMTLDNGSELEDQLRRPRH